MKWQINQQNRLFNGFFKIDEVFLQHELFAGGLSREIRRELIHRGQSVAVLPYDPLHDKLVLLKQFRIGALDQPDPWCWEIIAGMHDKNESDLALAQRELAEEAGLQAQQWQFITRYITSPGSSNEQMVIYLALLDLSQPHEGIFGLDEEGEDIFATCLSFDQAWQMLERGEINSPAPIIALQWLRLNRATLREAQ